MRGGLAIGQETSLLAKSQFVDLVKSELSIDLSADEIVRAQSRAIMADKEQSLFLVAGPGTGKTTAIGLRILKLLLVDAVPPEHFLATTFTRKAAAELSSQILGSGDKVRRAALREGIGDRHPLETLDFAKLRIGTLDSLAEEIMTDFRPPSAAVPTVIEDFAKRALMLRHGLFADWRLKSRSLGAFIRHLNGTNGGPLNTESKINFLIEWGDRLTQDLVNKEKLKASCKEPQTNELERGILRALSAIDKYNEELSKLNLLDFANLELKFLNRLEDGSLDSFLQTLAYLFVDEYQDTNALQERIYQALIRHARAMAGSICVVGDDDQALFRFRGATVELFSQFESRFNRFINGFATEQIFLNRNYRSTQTIIDFVDGFAELDASYKSARIKDKPKLVKGRGEVQEIPIIGIFRGDANELATAIAGFIDRLVNQRGLTLQSRQKSWKLELSLKGSANDVALLASSVREEANGQRRLPGFLRDALSKLDRPIKVFNPRGEALVGIQDVQCILGLMLECIDPKSEIQNSIGWLQSLPILGDWRVVARDFVKKQRDTELRRFVRHWAHRKPYGRRLNEIERISLNDLLYKLIVWLPNFLNDVERVTQLEALSRTIAEAAMLVSAVRSYLIPNQGRTNLQVLPLRPPFKTFSLLSPPAQLI